MKSAMDEANADRLIDQLDELLRVHAKQRVMAKVSIDGSSGCWTWKGQISNTGYGRLMLRKDGLNYMESAQRYSYETLVGKIPEGMDVSQQCTNRLCVNPEHLTLVEVLQQ